MQRDRERGEVHIRRELRVTERKKGDRRIEKIAVSQKDEGEGGQGTTGHNIII